MNIERRFLLFPVEKPWAALCLAACVAGAALAGYYCGLLRQHMPSHLSANTVPDVDYFLRTRSFSEVDNARAHLEALASQLIAEVRLAQTRARADRTGHGRPTAASKSSAIQSLQRLVESFQDTEQEPTIAAELLNALDRAGDCDAWLDLYLTILYRHPASDLPGSFAPLALDKARVADRELELQAAFEHLARIPLPLSAKATILSLPRHTPKGVSVTAVRENAARNAARDLLASRELN